MTVRELEHRFQTLSRRLHYLDAHQDVLSILKQRLLARDPTAIVAEDIIVSCEVCTDDSLWDYPGGSIARCLWCSPVGLGCGSFEEYCTGETEG